MLPPPPVLAPPEGAADALTLVDTRGVGGEVKGVAVVGDGLGGGGGGGGGLDGRGGGGVWQVQVGVGVGGGVRWHVHVGVGVGGGVCWHVHVGVGVGVGGGDWVSPPTLPLRLTAETLALI